VSEDIELVSKSVGEAVGALAQASGLLGPVQQLADYLTKRIYYRQLPTMARVAALAALKIERLGLPRASVDDPVVLRILEDSAGAQDESMQERWGNLLANTAASTNPRHHIAYARILAELEPVEAKLLDSLAANQTLRDAPVGTPFSVAEMTEEGVTPAGVDNLIRLGILHHDEPADRTWATIEERHSMIANLRFTGQGWAFVLACRQPELARSDPSDQPSEDPPANQSG
jgi:hypothetical protein